MVVAFTTTYGISAYHHQRCEFEYRSWRGVLDTTLCDKVCQRLATGRWFSPGIPVSPTNKTDRHDLIDIMQNKTYYIVRTVPESNRTIIERLRNRYTQHLTTHLPGLVHINSINKGGVKPVAWVLTSPLLWNDAITQVLSTCDKNTNPQIITAGDQRCCIDS